MVAAEKTIEAPVRRLRHEALVAARGALASAKAILATKKADRERAERRVTELEAEREIRERRREGFPYAHLDEARVALTRALSSEEVAESVVLERSEVCARVEREAPSAGMIAAWEEEFEASIERKRAAANELHDESFALRTLEIRRQLGDPLGLQSLTAELLHLRKIGEAAVRVFQNNTLGAGWWREGGE